MTRLRQSVNIELAAKYADAGNARQDSVQMTQEMKVASRAQSKAYNILGTHVSTLADGYAAFILSTGYGLRANPSPYPPLEPPLDVRTRVNGTPGRIPVSWKRVTSARNYEVQYTTDLTGATGWVSAAEMAGATRLNVSDLTSGTRYALRVRGCANSAPGPVQQLAP